MILNLTVVGTNKISDYVMSSIVLYGENINAINAINYGWLGNFSTLTYTLDISNEKFMLVRRNILNELSKPGSPVKCLYEHGAITNVYVFSKASFRNGNQKTGK